jgi:hypothetical protein
MPKQYQINIEGELKMEEISMFETTEGIGIQTVRQHSFETKYKAALPSISFLDVNILRRTVEGGQKSVANKPLIVSNCDTACWGSCSGSCSGSCQGNCTGDCSGSSS